MHVATTSATSAPSDRTGRAGWYTIASVVRRAALDPAADLLDLLCGEHRRYRHRVTAERRAGGHLVEEETPVRVVRAHPGNPDGGTEGAACRHIDQCLVGGLPGRQGESTGSTAMAYGRRAS